ncbi:pilus assembly protein PilM [Vibrio marisflavi]|uniref:Competence protein A n=1 Tax=Vibrio marisflavi CECT 7928 TaxID=634439 RepID=A0ABN8E768_9VIBR|nr:pilus assembly protein PilM [Vibrio marisflavi]CAH0541677.1 hypothetical protein VMF7928_03743 [Vibrio marisflavi CECT 7928]
MGNSLITGLDFSPKSVKAVVLKQTSQALRLICCKEIPIEMYVFSDNFTQDYQEIVKKLKELRKSLPSNSRKVSITIDDALVISKKIQIDSVLEGSERLHALTTAMSQQLACYPNELSIDFFASDGDSSNHLSNGYQCNHTCYQVYATKKSYAIHITQALEKAGFKPILMDSKARCLAFVWQHICQINSLENWLLVYSIGVRLILCISPRETEPYIHTLHAINPSEVTFDNAFATKQFIDEVKRFKLNCAAESIKGICFSGENKPTGDELERLSSILKLPCKTISLLSIIQHLCTASHFVEASEELSFLMAAGASMSGLQWLVESKIA